MSRQLRFSKGEFYHVYNRGVDKRIIFECENDFQRFLGLLHACNSKNPFNVRGGVDSENIDGGLASVPILEKLLTLETEEPIVSIGAYCLMPNHFHLLVQEITDGGITLFMHKLSTAYTMHFNKKYKRNGALFQGPFKAEHADSDKYLKYLFSYIHLNPIKIIDPKWREAGLINKGPTIKFLQSYVYSSYFDLIGKKREAGKILCTENFPKYFSNKKDLDDELLEWISFSVKTEAKPPYTEA